MFLRTRSGRIVRAVLAGLFLGYMGCGIPFGFSGISDIPTAGDTGPGGDAADSQDPDAQAAPFPPSSGACCWKGRCTVIREPDCAALDSARYLGEGTDCSACAAQTAEYLVWYTVNVSCWDAPLIYISSRADFERAESAASYPGGGSDYTVPLQKVELEVGFASREEARAWICPQFVSRFVHTWCAQYFQTATCNWQAGALGCDFNALPITEAPTSGTECPWGRLARPPVNYPAK